MNYYLIYDAYSFINVCVIKASSADRALELAEEKCAGILAHDYEAHEITYLEVNK